MRSLEQEWMDLPQNAAPSAGESPRGQAPLILRVTGFDFDTLPESKKLRQHLKQAPFRTKQFLQGQKGGGEMV